MWPPGGEASARRMPRLCAPAASAASFAPFLLLLLLPPPPLPASVTVLCSAAEAAAAAASAQAQPASPARSPPHRGGLLLLVPERPRAISMEIPTTHYPATRASSVVQNYINYHLGGPHKLFGVQQLHRATLEDIPSVGHKYRLKFSLEEALQKEKKPVNCTAEILYHHGDPHVAPEVHYTVEGEFGINTEQEDNKFYNRIKNLPKPLEAQELPDSFGYVPAEMEPIRHLALVACGYVIWQNSTEETMYNVAQVKSVNQVKRNDDYLEFSYVVLIHNFVASQDIIPWHLQVLWHPQHGVKVIRNSRQPKDTQ